MVSATLKMIFLNQTVKTFSFQLNLQLDLYWFGALQTAGKLESRNYENHITKEKVFRRSLYLGVKNHKNEMTILLKMQNL